MTKQDNEIAEKRRKESYLKYNHSEKGRATRKKWVGIKPRTSEKVIRKICEN